MAWYLVLINLRFTVKSNNKYTILVGNPQNRDNFENIGVDEEIRFKCIMKEQDVKYKLS
jgi:hypothetical protein